MRYVLQLRWLFPGMTKRNEKEISNIEVSTTVPLGYLVDGGAFVKRMKEVCLRMKVCNSV
ncbi:hypothetical protein WAI453_010826 [Rhynchosporium graminicola]